MKLFGNDRKFRSNNGGNVAVIFALTLLPLLLVAGFAIDAQLAFSKKGKIQRSVDSAMLAGARMMQNVSDKDEVKEHAQTYFDAIMESEGNRLTCDALGIKFPGPEEIEGTVTCYQPTSLMRLAGREYVELTVTGTATYGTGRLDVSFVFDVSGSMNSYGRIFELKTAAKDAVETLLPEPGSASDGDVRIAMVAYNSMIDAGNYFEDVTGLKKRRTYEVDYEKEECSYTCERYHPRWGYCMRYDRSCRDKRVQDTYTMDSTCIYERGGNYAFEDIQPKQVNQWQLVDELESGEYNAQSDNKNSEGYMAASYAEWSDYYERWYTRGEDECLNIPPFALSHNKTQINHFINSLYANGGTAGHQGIAWGWYMINDRWSDVFDGASTPLDKEEPDVVKAMIVMTDGEFNQQLFNSQGSSTEQAKDLCDTIKNDDVIIYTVAFQAPDAGKDVLEYCASGQEFYFSADNGQELVESYRAIATSISDLRISR
ncbi:pilus assembly protein TadG-related protein [Henriciella sp.]|uniref:TadE/TadG family type IV pilus assembly protein n=1 Tax=Henriciella sp. TaxID=1968823 RepID=UPI0026281BF6|nr:pilus assembly protein TadG-related protein [Henriciella sp.]